MMNCTKPTTLPFVDIHYSAKNFAQLFCKPGKFISVSSLFVLHYYFYILSLYH